MIDKYAFAGEKLARLGEPHIAQLTTFVDSVAMCEGYNQRGPVPEVPYFDPDDGGTDARMLFLMDTPVVKADSGTDSSGLISMENPDKTAGYIRRTHDELGVDRKLCAYWNIVPFPTETRPASPKEQRAATAYTHEVLGLFPNLKRIVLMGRAAREGWMRQGFPGHITPDEVFLPGRSTIYKPAYTEPYRALMRDIAAMAR